MWIVQLALPRTYTFVVVALPTAALGAVSIDRMSTDIFPQAARSPGWRRAWGSTSCWFIS